jgi:nucleotide-binding universal stress UspA family protein
VTAPKTILVPTDFSDTAKAALEYAKFLATNFGASLHLLHVLQSPLAYASALEASPELAYLREEMSKDARGRLERALTAAEREQFHVRLTTVCGFPPADIVEYAAKHDVDLIVMGTHGRSPIQHLFLGSVAEKVVRRAPCAVLTVRLPQHASAEPVAAA